MPIPRFHIRTLMIAVAVVALLQAAARNLGLILRKLFGMDTPRGL